MIYGPGNEKAAMAGNVYMPVTQSLAMAHEPQIKRTRKILVIILGVCLALLVMGAVSTVFEPSSDVVPAYNRRGTKLGNALVSILFFSFGLFVAHRYHVMGLRVFAWLGVISLVIYGIGGVVSIFALVAAFNTVGEGGDTKGIMTVLSMVLIAFIIAAIFVFILTFVIVKFAFRLAKQIETFKQSNNQQI